jgi:hypothetical protein
MDHTLRVAAFPVRGRLVTRGDPGYIPGPKERFSVSKVMAMIALLGLTAWAACDGARQARRQARRIAVVDCARLCARSFQECAVEVAVATGKVKRERVAALQAAGVFEKVQSYGHGACLRDCREKQGRGSDAGRINACLAKSGCGPFAECIKRVVQ